MGNELKGALFRALKANDIPFDKPYAQYKVAELQEAYDAFASAAGLPPITEETVKAQMAAAERENASTVHPSQPHLVQQPPSNVPVRRREDAPTQYRDPKEMAGQRTNTHTDGQPLRIDPDTGYTIYQEEVLKPAYPKPRGRRVLDYVETGTKVGHSEDEAGYRETFEMSGDAAPVTAQVKITLPSYQVGIHLDPRFPFKVVTYNSNEGFDLEDVERYYGGADLVPEDVLRKYVENVLCYDMRSVIRAIQKEARDLTLSGKL